MTILLACLNGVGKKVGGLDYALQTIWTVPWQKIVESGFIYLVRQHATGGQDSSQDRMLA